MSSQGFSFPPPPPPPPTQQQPPPYPPQYGQNYQGRRGGYGGSGHYRGRVRGHWNQGSRGGHFNAPDVSHQAPAPAPAYQPQARYQTQAHSTAGYSQVNYPAYSPQPLHNPPSSISPQSQYVAPGPPAYNQPPPAHTASYPSQPVQSQYPRQPGYDAAYSNRNHSNNNHQPGSSVYPSPYATQTPSPYPPPVAQPPHQPPPTVQPPMMGPPMRWGFETAPAAGTYHNGAGSYRGQGRGHRSSNSFGSSNGATGGDWVSKHPSKRNHASAFGKPQSTAPRVPAPAPVPSFGQPLLPSKPPAPADDERKTKKKKRRHNQLGLTPKTEEHESSEEEDYVDEEARLAGVGGGGGGAAGSAALRFTYKGRTSTLQSPAEIAAWIEERKKRFPTQARIVEKRKIMEEAKKAREEANRQREERRQEARRLHEARMQKEREKLERKEQVANSTDAADAVEYALRKAEKLRRKLAREERRVAKAEAEAEQARLRLETIRNGSLVPEGDKSAAEQGNGTTQEPDAQPASGDERAESSSAPDVVRDSHVSDQPSVSGDVATEEISHAAAATDGENTRVPPAAEGSDWSSSSMSEDTSSGSESSDADSAPEEASSRRVGPERVPPPPRGRGRDGQKPICRHFARSGHCLRGHKCRFSHELAERSQPSRSVAGERQSRKGLLNALLERQQEEEDRQVMQAIMWLGENGLLEEQTPS